MPRTGPKVTTYRGFEQGPIRPPSEANSLLIRVTRNCPWNRCTFCPVYKGSRFSIRPVSDVLADIDAVARYVEDIREAASPVAAIRRSRSHGAAADGDPAAFQAALHWAAGGMTSIFLQDANSLIIKPEDLLTILRRLRHRFPWVERITSYARSHTIARISDADLARMQEAGLNRIHIGMESGSDRVLKLVCKGVTRKTHIAAGQKVTRAGIQLSEYVMPGLGGRELSRVHAERTAEALNRIDPHFIRLRTLAIPNHTPLFDALQDGRFDKCTDIEMAEEILTFLRHLDGITSTVVSDHVLNLFQEIEGTLPQDKPRMMGVLEQFLALPPEERTLYQVGRRIGVFRELADRHRSNRRARVEQVCAQLGITPENVDRTIDELMKRFI